MEQSQKRKTPEESQYQTLTCYLTRKWVVKAIIATIAEMPIM